MKSGLVITLIIAISLFLFYRYGRSIYMPTLKKIIGKESVESISKKIESNVLSRLKPQLLKYNLTKLPDHLLLLGLKEEQKLEVYFKKNGTFQLLKTYAFTAFSGELGPKLKQGDLQIPEGIYKIDYLNPNSAYYLSMKVSYPNEFDISKSKFENQIEMGNDIFIHGKAVTIGCIPIGDVAIEELFLLVSNGLNQGVKVIISPRDFRKGKAFPKIDAIDWENELYQIIHKELNSIFQ
jgi:murein L,D-transpeptidase YafK